MTEKTIETTLKELSNNQVSAILTDLSKKYLMRYEAELITRKSFALDGDGWGVSNVYTDYLFDTDTTNLTGEWKEFFQTYRSSKVSIDYDFKQYLQKYHSTEPCKKYFSHELSPSKEKLQVLFAKKSAQYFHKDQTRKKSNKPYEVHLKSVADQCKYNDYYAKTVAWLHDIVEDTPVTLQHLEEFFGKEVALGVNYLTRNVGREEYKKRLLHAPETIQKIKLYDTLDNTFTLRDLSDKGIQRKVNDCITFYIPLAIKLGMEKTTQQLFKHIKSYYNV